MSVIIEDIENSPGYDDFVAMLNNEIQNPTGGVHTPIITDIVNTIQANDYYGFISELYIDRTTYWGCLFIDKNERALVIENNEIIYTNINSAQVGARYQMEDDGLNVFYSGKFPLFTKAGAATPNVEIDVVGTKEFGDDIYYNYLTNDNIRTYTGRISGQEIENQILGSYNIKIDKLPLDLITMVAKRDDYTQFQVRIATNVVEDFSYQYIGQVLYVQDTEISRESVRLLEREGVISSNL